MLTIPVQFMIALRGLRTRLGRTLLTMAGVTLGVAVVLAVQVTNRSTMDSVERMFRRATGQAELMVVPPEDQISMDGSLMSRVLRTEGVALAAPSLSVRTALVSGIPDTFTVWTGEGVKVGRGFELRGIDTELDPQVRLYELVEGRMPQAGRYEAVLPGSYASQEELRVGGTLEFVTPNGAETLEIVGLLADEGAAMTNSGAAAFAPLDVVQQLFEFGQDVSEIAVQVEAGIGSNADALAVVKESLGERLGLAAQVVYPAAGGDLVPRMLSSYQMGLLLFSVIAIFTGAFLIYNTFSMTVVERTQEIGMLRAIGMDRRQVLSMVLAEAMMLGAAGCSLGVPVGLFMARSLTALAGGFLTMEASLLSLASEDLLLSLGIGLGVTFTAALLPARQAATTPPLEALRVQARTGQPVRPLVWLVGLTLLPLGWLMVYHLPLRQPYRIPGGVSGFFVFQLGVVLTVPLGIVLLERLVRLLVTVLYRNEGALGSSNVCRSVLRSSMTVASLMISLIMIIGVGSMTRVIITDITGWVDNAVGGDLLITAEQPLRLTFADKLYSLPGVSVVSPMRVMEVRVGAQRFGTTYLGRERREKLYFIGIDPPQYRLVGEKEFVSGQGNPGDNWKTLEEGDAIFITSVMAEEYEVQQGDTFSLVTRRGEHAFRIAAVTTEFSRQGYVLTGTFDDLQRWFGETGANQFTLRLEPGADPQALAQMIRERYQERYNLKVQTTQTYRSSVLELLTEATRLFEVLSLVGVVIGAMGVLNTMTMNVLERQREIGGLRSLGMLRSQVVKMVLAEALALGAIGAVFGLLFGYGVSHIFLYGINSISSYELDYLFNARPYALSLMVALGISQLAALSPAQRAASVNIIEALKHE